MWGHACVAGICYACACGRYSVTLSVRCFRLLSSMCRTSEIDGRCVHLRGSDRCEISYAATLTRSMFEDPIGVNFIICWYTVVRELRRGFALKCFSFTLLSLKKTKKRTSYVLYSYLYCVYALAGGAISIRNPYICAIVRVCANGSHAVFDRPVV